MRFLLVFSTCIIAIAGVVWACSYEDDNTSSIFAPELFVSYDYSPFFYDAENWYYGENVEIKDNNNRFNEQIISEWDNYLNHELNKPALEYLLLRGNKAEIDSVYDYLNGKTPILKPESISINRNKLNKEKMNNLFNYLRLAKDCEKFAVGSDQDWYSYTKPVPEASPALENSLAAALEKSKNTFIKQRLWFQLTRYYFFNDDTTSNKKGLLNKQSKILVLFDKYKNSFTKNLTYYRTLGYLAGYYRRKGNYAEANYLYSLCYDYSFEMKIPSKFSFHVQQEADWQETLKLAKNKEEKITLWHMLGMEYDPERAIKEIAALDPRSDKMDLLLSRIINIQEYRNNFSNSQIDTVKADLNTLKEFNLIDSIALKNNTAKPYYWNIAAGYLNYMQHDYKKAGYFYAIANKQLPADDPQIMTQYELLTSLLHVAQPNHIDAKTEAQLVEPLNFLKDLAMVNGTNYLRYAGALKICSDMISAKYKDQGDTLKANCFSDALTFYTNSARVQQLVNLMNKPNKSAFEKTMLRYYPHSVDELYYFQATVQTYRENIDKAVTLMNKTELGSTNELLGDPFSSRLIDCHDCDHEAVQKQKFTALSLLKTIKGIKTDLKAGKNKYKNALLLANAFYNITYYGNARLFYQFGIIEKDPDYLNLFHNMYTSQKIAEKYYLLARNNAQTNEQKALCTYMAAKCEHNTFYNRIANSESAISQIGSVSSQNYFSDLKKNYANTKFYQEILHECGYFRTYVIEQNKSTDPNN